MNGLVDLRKVLTEKHQDKWVALSGNLKKVIGYSEDLVALKNKVGVKKVVYMKVPESGRNYAF